MALFKGNSGQQLSLRLSSLLRAGKTCHQQLRMLHLRQNDLSEILAGLDLQDGAAAADDPKGRGSKLEYGQIFHQGPPADVGHERLMSKVGFIPYSSPQISSKRLFLTCGISSDNFTQPFGRNLYCFLE